MLSEEGKEHLREFIPSLQGDRFDSYAGSSELTDDMIEALTTRYSDKFAFPKERENLLISLLNGVRLDELNHCVDICVKDKQKPPYLHYQSVDGDIDTSETIRLYCFAYKTGESLNDIDRLDSLVECMQKAENLAECYHVGAGTPCLITNINDMHDYCLTPGHLEEIFDDADGGRTAIGIVYYIDFTNMQISGKIIPDYPNNNFASADSYKDLKPFIVRKFNSFKNLSTKINDFHRSAFISESLDLTRSEINRAIAQNNECMGRDLIFKDIVISAYNETRRPDNLHAYADRAKPARRNARRDSGPEL